MKKDLFVIKIGGHVLNDTPTLHHLLQQVALLNNQCILVHGGGRKATALCADLGIESQFVQGRRITDTATLEIAVMVYAGLMNKQIVAYLQGQNVNAIGVCGADWNLLAATKRPLQNGIDFGWVGDIRPDFNWDSWQQLLQMQSLPVIAPITHDGQGQLLNTNADTIASSIAIGLAAHYHVHLVYLFEKAGVLQDVKDDTSIIKKITPATLPLLIKEGIVQEGMVPKLENAVQAVKAGVASVKIGHADQLAAILIGEQGSHILHD